MSVRDEIGERAIEVDMNTDGQWSGAQMADALMPIVERVAQEAVSAHRANQVAMQATINAQESEIFDLKNQLRRAGERQDALRRMFLGA